MYHHILVGTDGSEHAQHSADAALRLAKALGAKVTAVTVTDIMPTGPYSPVPWPATVEQYEASAASFAEGVLARVRQRAASLGIACNTHHSVDQSVAEGILAAADEHGCDLIVLGAHSRHHGLSGWLLGSQVNKVLSLARVPVLVCR